MRKASFARILKKLRLNPSVVRMAHAEGACAKREGVGLFHIELIPASVYTAELPEAEWLVEDIFERDSIVVLFGPPGSCKSFLALDWACSIAEGAVWKFGKRTEKGTVAYVAAEGPKGMTRRTAAWQQYFNDKKPVEGLHFVPVPVPLQNKDALKELIQHLQVIKPKLVVIDTLAACFTGDENSAEDMGTFVSATMRIKRELHGCAVLILHHIPVTLDKRGGTILRERGSGALRGGIDVSIAVLDVDGMVHVQNMKQKEEAKFAPMTLGKEVVVLKEAHETKNGKPMTSLVLVEIDGEELIHQLNDTAHELLQIALDYLQNERIQSLSWDQWVEAFNSKRKVKLSEKHLRRMRKTLETKGLTKQDKRGGEWRFSAVGPTGPTADTPTTSVTH